MRKIGILGGGQLGRMLLQAAANYPVTTYVMENDPSCPAAHLCHHFTLGNIRNFDAVYEFGKNLDGITIEIENVNVDALEKLEQEGVKVYPKPAVLRTIKNKILQKEYYRQHEIPTAAFTVTQNRAELQAKADFLPAVHKLGEGGYDGKGVQLLPDTASLEKGFDAPSVLEKAVDIQKRDCTDRCCGQQWPDGSVPTGGNAFRPRFKSARLPALSGRNRYQNIVAGGSDRPFRGKKFSIGGLVCR